MLHCGWSIQHPLQKTFSRDAMWISPPKMSSLAVDTMVTGRHDLEESGPNIPPWNWIHLLASEKYLDQEALCFLSKRDWHPEYLWPNPFSLLFHSNSDFKNWKVSGVNFIGDLSDSCYFKSFQDFKQFKIQFSLPNTAGLFLIKYRIRSFPFIEIWIHLP